MTEELLQDGPGRSHLELALELESGLVTPVRRFVLAFLRQACPPELAGRATVTVHELVENVVKYTSHGRAWLRIELDTETGHFAIATKNHASPEHIAALRRVEDTLKNAESPEAAFLELMERSSNQSGSRLGIGRIATEAAGAVRCYVDDDLLTVRCDMDFEGS